MMNNLFTIYQQMMQNPLAMLTRRFNIPQNVNTSDPYAIIQHLLDSGQVSQAQINNIMQMRNNPAIQSLMKGGR